MYCLFFYVELRYVYDVTVGYPYVLPESELSMALGECPQEVHYFVRRWPISDIPVSCPVELDNWLNQQWQKKEEMLKAYYGALLSHPPCHLSC